MIKQPFIFLTRNYLKSVCDANGAETDILSQIKDAQRQTFPKEITVFFTDDFGNITNRNIDSLFLKSTNIKNLVILAAGNNGEYSELFNITGNTSSNLLIKNESIKVASGLKLIVKADNPDIINFADIGVCGFLCALNALTDASLNIDCNAESYRTAGGRIIHYKDFSKFKAKIKINNMPAQEFRTLKSEVLSSEKLTVVPFKDHDLNAIYECYVSPELEYGVDRKTELYETALEVQEL